VLSLTNHGLTTIPSAVFQLVTVRTLDLSNNKLKVLPDALANLKVLKSLNCEHNKLTKGSISPSFARLKNLTILSLGNNRLGMNVEDSATASNTAKKNKSTAASAQDHVIVPIIPSLKQLKLNHNQIHTIPPQIYSPLLVKLELLDLSNNNIEVLPAGIQHLVSLQQLNLDHNALISLPDEIGKLVKLKSLSLQHNQICHIRHDDNRNNKYPQPLPSSLFTDTALIDLTLAGNPMTNTQLNEFEGFATFLERRQKLKSKNIYGGALTDLSVCGLD
jgi:Leucine-rich repeat (LRR) protein